MLRPGGAAVVSNIHHLSLPLGGVVQMLSSTGQGIRLAASPFMPTDYTNAALGAGFEIRSCAEVGWPDLPAGHVGTPALDGAGGCQAVGQHRRGSPSLSISNI